MEQPNTQIQLKILLEKTLIMNISLAKPSELDIIYYILQETAIWLKSKNLTQWEVWLNPLTAPTYLRDWIEKSLLEGEFYFVKGKNLYKNENLENESQHFLHILGMYRLMYKDDMFWENTQEQAGYIHSFVVRRHYKGQNLGTKMLQHIENILKDKNIGLMRLDCNASNIALCKYYENQGFIKVGQKQMDWGINNLYEKKIINHF